MVDGTSDRKPTLRVTLPGGQERLRQLILYVSQKCAEFDYFGSTKLNKIIWRADFEAFSRRGIPVTGREYQRLEFGPAPKEMLPLLRDMNMQGLISIERRQFSEGVEEKRTVALKDPDLSLFNADDIRFVDEAIFYYQAKTAAETSSDSHGVAWRTRSDGDAMPYELAFLSDEELSEGQAQRFRDFIAAEGIFSR